jgi:hypothetical protein
MNWEWATSLDQLWRSPVFPMWLTVAAAAFFGVLMLVTLVRAEKSVANGALTVIALLAVGIAVAATIRGPFAGRGSEAPAAPPVMSASLPALSCLDDLAGEIVLSACEKAVFASAESTAAAVSYVGFQIARLMVLGDAATAKAGMTPELQAMRRAVERDRYGMVAQVLQERDHCTPTECAAFRSMTDNHQIITNMDEHVYEGLVARYAQAWNAPLATAAVANPAVGAIAGPSPSLPTGRPTNAEFPTAASTPPVSIMTPEPGTSTTSTTGPRAQPASAPSPSPRPTSSPALAAAKKSAPKPSRPAISPPNPAPAAPAPAASND